MANLSTPNGKPSSPTTLVFEYGVAYNAIVEPLKYVPATQYFIRRWMPLLGGTGTQIVLALRSLGFYNPKTGEKRDGIEIDMPALAELIGVSVATLKREFGDKRGPDVPPGTLQNPTLHRFISREKQYRRAGSVILRCQNIYRVRMDDPLHDDDLPRYQEVVSSMEKGAAAEVESRKAQNEPYRYPVNSRKAQNTTGKAQSEPRVAQNEPCAAHFAQKTLQNELALKDYSLLPENTKDDLKTTGADAPASVSDFQSAIAFQREEKEKRTQDAALTWERMSDEERRPFEESAETELCALFGETEWRQLARKSRQIETRAYTLFQKAQGIK